MTGKRMAALCAKMYDREGGAQVTPDENMVREAFEIERETAWNHYRDRMAKTSVSGDAADRSFRKLKNDLQAARDRGEARLKELEKPEKTDWKDRV